MWRKIYQQNQKLSLNIRALRESIAYFISIVEINAT